MKGGGGGGGGEGVVFNLHEALHHNSKHNKMINTINIQLKISMCSHYRIFEMTSQKLVQDI